jgi:single-stranded-DNA-specific exonuclease
LSALLGLKENYIEEIDDCMQKRWVELSEDDSEKTVKLSHELNINKALSSLLVKRGIHSFKDAKKFFRPMLTQLHDPFLMKDMDKAIARIEEAIGNNEKIVIYGDYDVDGTTAVAVVYSFFREFHSKLAFYIPDRYEEGYGISKQGIDWASENGYSLIIALDCGIKALDQVAYAKEKGIDFIIGDHHMPGDVLPSAVAVLDPKRADCSYPYDELSGCGIGFKIIQAFAIKNAIALESVFKYLDLVAVSIASDIVPITGENRVLAFYGLKKLNSNPCFGLLALMNLTGRKDVFTIEKVVFQIGPRINAAGRIKHAKDAVSLLISSSLADAEGFSEGIDIQNTERKEHDSRITEQALSMIRSKEEWKDRKTTVVYQNDWHKGVIGIVASRLTEKYYRPTIVLTHSNGVVAGSARSVVGYDLYEALDACSDLLEQFGGHKYAAGLTMREENIPALQDRFEEVVSASILPEMLIQEISIDQELNLTDIDGKFFRILKQFAPFGPLNRAPIFISKGVTGYGSVSLVGSNHVKFSIVQGDSSPFSCIGFGLGEFQELIASGEAFDICYSIEENSWREKVNIQLNIKGIKRINP